MAKGDDLGQLRSACAIQASCISNQFQFNFDRRQRLAQLIMEFPRDPPSLFLQRLYHLVMKLVQFLLTVSKLHVKLGITDRQRSLGG